MVRKTSSGHQVEFDPSFNRFTLLSEQVVCDFIDVFYAYDENERVVWRILNTSDGDFNGQHTFNSITLRHTISFNEKNIRRRFRAGTRVFGGNLKLSKIDERLAAALVLTHELQHANQAKTHVGNMNFYGYLGGYDSRGRVKMKQYKWRPCERDAREFVDAHINEIFAYFDQGPPRRSKVIVPDDSKELVAVADLLLECAEISMDDVRDELRASRILNPKNVRRMLEILQESGMSVS
jgi:hypothetical protein